MTRFLSPLLAFVSALLLLTGLPARADTEIQQKLTFRGPVNFTGTVETLRAYSNTYSDGSACSILSGVSASLSGIPSGAKILSAQLYWAGSGNTPDYSVNFDGHTVRAPTERQYFSQTGNGINYFSGAADVTAYVDGNRSYTFSGLSVTATNPWCSTQAVVGGFALVVVYSSTGEPFRLLNIYEGFKYFQNNGFTIDLGNFNVPKPLGNATGRVGHVTWEGDSTLSQGGETLKFNGIELTDDMNPAGNQFNSASNITRDRSTWGVDFDAYTLGSDYISPGQNTASTSYRSGQDLVLLSAEIVAMPFVGNADLALAMSRTGDLFVGATAYYTLTVTNNGSDVEVGPVTITDTLPAGLRLVSTSGSGWSCTSSAGSNGTTVVTCKSSGQVAAGAKTNALTVTVTPTSAGTYTNTATVSGMTGDSNAGNNTATNGSAAIDPGSATVVFTTEVCKNGDPIVTAPSDAGCHRFIGPVVAGASDSKIYVTATSGNKAMAIDRFLSSPFSIDLAATCLPFSKVALTYAGQTLDCVGGWKSVQVSTAPNSPTGVLPNDSSFFYADVGRITLQLRYAGSVMGKVDFISRPRDIRFQTVFRNSDGVADLQGAAGDNWKKPAAMAFAKAGEPFTMRLGAWMDNGAWAPSFGKEAAALSGKLAAELLDLDFELDLFAADPLASPVLPVTSTDGRIDALVKRAFSLDQAFTPNATIAGAFDARARWFEASYLGATPYLADYLGTGQVGGLKEGVDPSTAARLVTSTRVIGHFYPDHFETSLSPAFACPTELKCPVAPDFAPSGAVYATQPFKLAVAAFALPRDGQPQPLSLFRNLAGSAANGNIVGKTVYRSVALSAAVKPTDTTSRALAGLTLDPAAPLPTSSGPTDFPAMNTGASYTLGKAYTPTDATSGKTAPTLFYLRATMRERVTTSAGITADVTVDSSTPAATPTVQYEDGLMVVSGRLLVPNVFGSELLNLPANLAAQYWNGTSWVTNPIDNASTVAQKLVFVKCARSFASDPATGACKADPVAMAGPGPVQLVGGTGKLVLRSPGRGVSGSVEYTVSGGNAAAWLPSTRGRATFGVYKSPIIYLREVY